MHGHIAMPFGNTIHVQPNSSWLTAEPMDANALMKRNVIALLEGRRQTRRDLARWCRRSDSWLSKILKEDRREFPLKYWERIAAFFGLSPYQLLQPGISSLTERRHGSERRTGRDRRLRNVALAVHDRLPLARAVADEVFRLDQDDLVALAAQLAEMKHQRIGGPSTKRSAPALPSAAALDEPARVKHRGK